MNEEKGIIDKQSFGCFSFRVAILSATTIFSCSFLSPLVSATELEDELFGVDSAPLIENNQSDNLEDDLFGGNNSNDQTEDALFGGGDEDQLFGGGSGSPAGNSLKDILSEKLENEEDQFFIGGKYYHSFSVTGTENQKTKEASYSSDGVADIYFDAALDDGVRFFMKQKIQQSFSQEADDTAVVDFSGPEAVTSIDQMWLKFDYRNKLYMTFGRQPTSWGSGFVWAPTDFINEETESPFALSDQRLGVSLVKFQYPLDVQGINLYGVFQTNEANTIGQVKSLFRAEKIFEQSELALSVASQSHQELKVGVDYSTGLKWFDWYVNVGATKHDQGLYYERPPGATEPTSDDFLGLLQSGVNGETDEVPENAQLIVVDRSDERLRQVSTGIIYIKAFDDSSQLIVNSEFFYNEKGYDDDEILTLLLLQNPAAFDPLYFSKRYAALGLTRAGIGNSAQTYGLQYIKSLSDSSAAVIASFGFNPFKELNFSSNLIVFTGGSGVFNPFDADAEALEETAQRVADGELEIPEEVQDGLPDVLVAQDTDPVTATVGETSFEGPRFIVRTQLSLSF